MYAESDVEGVHFLKPELPIISAKAWDVAQQRNVIVSNTTNILLVANADPNRGVIYDSHDTNASRRYKAFGSFWSDEKQAKGDCARPPSNTVDGHVWPACTNIGVAYSSDGIHFDHAQDESNYKPGNQPGTRDIGQDDGALDLAVSSPPPPPPLGWAVPASPLSHMIAAKVTASFSPQISHGAGFAADVGRGSGIVLGACAC